MIKLSRIEKVRFEKNWKVSEFVKEIPERRGPWAEETASSKALRQESGCKDQQGSHCGWRSVSKGEDRGRQS